MMEKQKWKTEKNVLITLFAEKIGKIRKISIFPWKKYLYLQRFKYLITVYA